MKVAVVGSGVSGLAATWLLNKYSNHEVHVYEADSRPGGHANTVQFSSKALQGKDGVNVDTGFIVLNPTTYPNFLRFLEKQPDLRILPTEMTFSVSRDGGQFEWAGNNLFTVFCQPSRLLDPNMWRLLYDVLRFNACARRLVIGCNRRLSNDDISIGDYLQREAYSASFCDNYLIPMTAAIWSTPPDTCIMDFPARTLLQFLNNHHLLQITGKPSWLTIEGGSINYVNAILSSLPEGHLHLSTQVKSVSTKISHNGQTKVILTMPDGSESEFDHVILACHSDTTLSILEAGGGLEDSEKRVLSRFRWSKNEVVLHSDIRLMPKHRSAWSCWNYLTFSTLDAGGQVKPNVNKVSLTYGMNDLQHIPEREYGPVLVTLNPPMDPAKDMIVGRYAYDHPVLDSDAVRSQLEMPSIQGKRGISFAGAWLGYGFHEDGFTSGLRAVIDHIGGVKAPFDIQYPDREPQTVFVAHIFDILEVTGARALIGAVLSFFLFLCRGVVGLVLHLKTQDNIGLRKVE